jgi:hypothetical protein
VLPCWGIQLKGNKSAPRPLNSDSGQGNQSKIDYSTDEWSKSSRSHFSGDTIGIDEWSRSQRSITKERGSREFIMLNRRMVKIGQRTNSCMHETEGGWYDMYTTAVKRERKSIILTSRSTYIMSHVCGASNPGAGI